MTTAEAPELAPKSPWQDARGFAARLALACLPAIAGAVYFHQGGATPAELLDRLGTVPPWATFALIAFAPLIGAPLAPLYAYAGLRHGPVVGYAISLAGVATDLALAHPLYGALLRRPLKRLLDRRGWDPARLQGRNRLRLTILVASVPALPFWAQNAALAGAGIPFLLYFGVSLAVQAVFAAGGVALGVLGRDAAVSTPLILVLLAAIPATVLIVRLLRKATRKGPRLPAE